MGTAVLPCELDFKGKDYIRIRRNNAEDFNFAYWFPNLGHNTPTRVSFAEFTNLLLEAIYTTAFSDEEKPQWISLKQIREYHVKMLEALKNKVN